MRVAEGRGCGRQVASSAIVVVLAALPVGALAAGTAASRGPGTSLADDIRERSIRRAAPTDTIPSSRLLAWIKSGRPVELTGVVVEGDLDLRAVETVTHTIRCFGCTFDGDILASDVVFQRVVDLTGDWVSGSLDLRGAIFEDAMLLRAGARAGEIDGSASFSLATFRDRARFDGSVFSGPVDFSGAKFQADASFADVEFLRGATFELSSFGGSALFSSTGEQLAPSGSGSSPGFCTSEPSRPISFLHATFRGATDLRQRCFAGDADFRSAAFLGPVDATLVVFEGTAGFNNAVFGGRTSFRVVTFAGDAAFDGAVATGPISFEGAIAGQGFSLFEVSVAGSLSVSAMHWAEPWDAEHLSTGSLLMDLDGVSHVRGERVQEDVLGQIERSAAARGDLAGANNARYNLLSLQGDRASGVHRLADSVGYRLIAGYLVRPSHPFAAFCILLLIVAVIRAVPRYRTLDVQPEAVKRTEGSASRSTFHRLRIGERATLAFLGGLAETARRAFRAKPDIDESENDLHSYRVAAVKGVEYVAFKVLIALVLLSLANSNQTLRQLIDAVRG